MSPNTDNWYISNCLKWSLKLVETPYLFTHNSKIPVCFLFVPIILPSSLFFYPPPSLSLRQRLPIFSIPSKNDIFNILVIPRNKSPLQIAHYFFSLTTQLRSNNVGIGFAWRSAFANISKHSRSSMWKNGCFVFPCIQYNGSNYTTVVLSHDNFIPHYSNK